MNANFCRVSAENNQRSSAYQVYIERIPQTTSQEKSRRFEGAPNQMGSKSGVGAGRPPIGQGRLSY